MKTYHDMATTAHLPILDSLEEHSAEELIFLVHQGVDWKIWGGQRLNRYWDALAERVRAATYAGPTIDMWWDDISTRMGSQPSSAQARARLIELMSESNNIGTLKVLRSKGSMLVLRVRVMLEINRENAEIGAK